MTARDNVNDAISSAGFVPRSNTTIGRPPSRNSGGKQELKEDDLIVRVRERSTTTNSEERPRTRLGSFLSRRGGGGSNENAALQSIVGNSIEKKANEFKEQLKRPLSSLFRRTQSNDRSQQQSGGIKQRNITQQQQQSSFINNKTNRIPSAVGGRSTTLITGMGTTDNNESTTINGIIGNNNNISTTAIRPFTGINKREIIKQQNDEINKLEIDLSEQAAIAPSMRRFSGFSATDPSSSLFIMRQQKQKRQQHINKGNNIENKEEIDVNFLSRFLCPEDEIQDENIPWTWDSLFASVTSELREEWALEEEALNSEGGNNNEQIIPGGGIPTN